MTAWQRSLRLGLALFVVVLAVTLFVSLRAPTQGRRQPPVRQTDPKAVTESKQGRVLLATGAKQELIVEYQQLAAYADGRSRLLAVRFKLLQRGGRDILVTAQAGEIAGAPPKVDVKLRGAVAMTSSDGLKMEADEASYTDGEGVARAPGPVTFSGKPMRGTAVGMTYDKNRDVLSLLERAVIHLLPDEHGEGGADIEAGRAMLARRDRYIRLEGGVRIVRQTQTVSADTAVLYLTEDEKRIQSAELRGGSRVTGNDPAPGGLRRLSANDMDLTYAPDGRNLQRALLVGTGSIELAGPAGRPPNRRIAGQIIDLGFAPDGATVTQIMARERVQLDLPADGQQPGRTIRGGTLAGSGEAATGLTSANFEQNVEFRESPPPPAAVRVATAQTLDLTMPGGFGRVDAARFGGGVRFEQGTMTATSQEARYLVLAGALNMAGADPKTGRAPQVIDDQARIEGRRIEIQLDAKKVTAVDAAKTEMRPASAGERRAGVPTAAGPSASDRKDPVRMPGMLKQDQPVFATANGVVYDSGVSLAVYTGAAQLWQGETSIKADRITLDAGKGDLSASGSVVSRMLLVQVDEKTKAKEEVNSIATAKDMAYEDKSRRATYTTKARLNGPQGDLTGDKIEVYLNAGGNEVDRIEAYVGVFLRTPDGRRSSGDRLSYQAKEERYDVLGLPVRIEDETGEFVGKSLTFWRSTDRIVLDGKEEKRTEMKRGVKKQGLRFD